MHEHLYITDAHKCTQMLPLSQNGRNNRQQVNHVLPSAPIIFVS